MVGTVVRYMVGKLGATLSADTRRYSRKYLTVNRKPER
jgi:hypothetical protein